VRIAPNLRMPVVEARSDFTRPPQLQTPHDWRHTIASRYACQRVKASMPGTANAGHNLKVSIQGWVFNSSAPMHRAAPPGFGLTYLPEDMAPAQVTAGQLIRVLDDWSPTFPGCHLYYPSHRQSSPASAQLVNALCYPR